MSTFSHSLYDTRFLKYKDNKIHFPRTGTYRSPIPRDRIKRITLTKGISTIHPVRTIIFGILIIIFPIYFVPFDEDIFELFMWELEEGYGEALFEVVILYIQGGGFLAAIGILALIHATIRIPIFKIDLENGKSRIIPLWKFKAKRDIRDIVDFFEIVFKEDEWYIDYNFDQNSKD